MATADDSNNDHLMITQCSPSHELTSKISHDSDGNGPTAIVAEECLLSQTSLEGHGVESDGDSSEEVNNMQFVLTQAPVDEEEDGDSSTSNNNLLQTQDAGTESKSGMEAEEEVSETIKQNEPQAEESYQISHSKLHSLVPSGVVPSFSTEEFSSDDENDNGYDCLEDEDDDDEDDEDENENPRLGSLHERRTRNILRNKNMVQFLGLASKSPANEEESNPSEKDLFSPQQPPTPKPLHAPLRGMLFATPYNSSEYENASTCLDVETDEAVILERLQEAYPHRESQIQQLWSLLSPALPPPTSPNGRSTTKCVPAPIFVTGTAGTGKTSVVRDVVKNLKLSRLPFQSTLQARVGCAYVNCATLGADATIDELLHNAYGQLARMKAGRQYQSPKRKRKRKIQKEKKSQLSRFMAAPNVGLAKKRRKEEGDSKDSVPLSTTAPGPETQMQADQTDQKPSTELGAVATSNPEPNQTKTANDVEPRRSRRERRVVLPKESGDQVQGKTKTTKALNADLKASTSPGEIARTNTAGSRDKDLNLTIIVITKSILLEQSRFNNVVAVEKSLTTLMSAIQPQRVHFQAYKGKDRFRQILAQKRLLQRIVGPEVLRSYLSEDENDKFMQRVVNSFLNMLVQSLYGGCRDLKEIVRLGRSLWPLYVLPLHSTKIEQTMKSVQKMFSLSKDTPATTASAGKHILSFLDVQILPEMRQKLDQCIYTLRDEGLNSGEDRKSIVSGEGLPFLTKCLMLAAFICQTNRADKDKQLLTIQKNGKKNNGNKRKSPGEDVAFGGAAKTGVSKLYRPRMFPMERMLSVFVSIVGLNQGQANPSKGLPSGTNAVDPSATGSSDFFESLSYLRDIGVLHEAANPAAPRFWCSLTKEEADACAGSVNFQLESYLF